MSALWHGSAPAPARGRTPSIIAGFAIIIGLLLGVSAVGLAYMTSISQQLARVVNEQNLQTDLITRMRNLSRERSLLLSSMLINPDPFARDEAFMALREKGEAFIRARTELGASELDTEERGVLEAIDLAASRTARHQYRVIDLLHLERFAEATRVLLENVIPAQDRVVAHMDTFVRLQEEQNGRASARAGAQFRDGYLLILVLGSAALLVSIAVGRKVNQRIATALADLEVARLQLQRSNEELEARVQERTKALRLANESLRAEVLEREQAQAALGRSELRYRSFVEHFQGIAFQSDLHLRPIFVHGAVEIITGHTEADFLAGRVTWEELVDPEDCQAFVRDFANPLRRVPGFACEGEYRIRRRDGSVSFLQGFMRNVADDAGRIQLIEGTLFDVTERKRAELALQESESKLRAQAEQLAEADRRKDEFLALLGHELRNPLAPIRHAIALVRRDTEGGRMRAWACDVIDRQSEQLSRLVDDLLVIARITRGRLELRLETLEATEVVRHALDAVCPLMQERGHSVHLMHPPGGWWVQADPTRLEQVVVNLLNNAAIYSEPGQRIEVEVRAEDTELAIEVRDQGFGMAPALLARVFDPFTRGERSAERSRGGLGLGLALVRQLVELHGGRVSAHSEGSGRGTRVEVRLPLSVRPAAAAVPYRVADAARQPLRLLVVDDNRDVAESLSMLLGTLGHEVHVAPDGTSALEMTRETVPDAVFLDLGLPDIDGYEVARQLRAGAGPRTYLVAMTGYGQDSDRRRSARAGFDRHLLKPARLEEIEAVLDEAAVAKAGGWAN